MAFVKVKECLTDPRELLKLILLVLCVCITIYQLSESVGKLLNPPITSYYKVKYNETIKYPVLTICRRPGFKKELWKVYGIPDVISDLASVDSFKEFNFDKFSVHDFMNTSSFALDEISYIIAFKQLTDQTNLDIKSAYYHQRGLCHTIIPKETVDKFSIEHGYYLYLRHTTRDKIKDSNGLSIFGFEIHIHSENDVINEENLQSNYLYLENAEVMRITLSVQTYSQLPTKKQPCIAEANYSKILCDQKCLYNTIAKRVGCKVPWLKYLDQEYAECDNMTALFNINNLLALYRQGKMDINCLCPIPCNNTVYKYQIESRKETDALLGSSSILSIYFPSNVITDLSEVMSYDWNVFLADVGGSLGFLLGLSVIGFVNIIENIIKLLCLRKKKGKNHNEDECKREKKLEQLHCKEEDSFNNVMNYINSSDNYQQLKNGGSEPVTESTSIEEGKF